MSSSPDRLRDGRIDTPGAGFGHEFGRRLWIVVVAGIPTGVVVAGIGSRLAMLLLRLTSPASVRGMTSDDGFEIGRVTLSGTHNLLMLGAGVGVVGAVAYQAVRPWLLGPSWFRRLTVGAASGAVVGSIVVQSEGIDFRVLQPTWLAIALFVALPGLFGVAISVAVDRVAARPLPTGRRRWVVPVLLVVAFPLVITLVAVVAIGIALWIPVTRGLARVARPPMALGLAVRAGWLTVAVLGLVALVEDVRAL